MPPPNTLSALLQGLTLLAIVAFTESGCAPEAGPAPLAPGAVRAPQGAPPGTAKQRAVPASPSDANPPAAVGDSDGYHDAAAELDDDIASAPSEVGVEIEHPLAHMTTDELEKALVSDPDSLGSMSVGTPNAGRLFNGVKMPEGEHWRFASSDAVWGTEETVGFVTRCIEDVADRFPGTSPLPVGHISSRKGGPLSPHVSHQSGRDVDLGYYYTDNSPWYTRARDTNLDRPRTWQLIRCLVAETDVEMILIDVSLQRLLRKYAESIGENPSWLDSVFDGVPGRLLPLLRHAGGHATHLHVRFYNPIAQETARRVDPLLLRHGKVSPPMRTVSYRAKKGDTLGKLARRFHTTVPAIKHANGLRSSLIRANVTYRIPCPSQALAPSRPVRIPPRRLPPTD
ncbi:MAG: penicillin-insensitive murein endopeptidase [Polyangiaceae bacterium]|nr:penicillin-insensitive murein endopeptidase [Polyangiaceae bacterium]